MRSKIACFILSVCIATGFAPPSHAARKKKDRLTELSQSKSTPPTHKRMIQHYRDQREGRTKIKEKRRAVLKRKQK